jgi:hypothetical protein
MNSAPSAAFEALAGTARSEPPRKVGVTVPAVAPGIAKVAMSLARAGLPPPVAAVTEEASQPAPKIRPVWP